MMKILFATTNPAKVLKYKKPLEEEAIELITLKDLGFNLKIEENGKDALENAYIKQRLITRQLVFQLLEWIIPYLLKNCQRVSNLVLM